MIPVHLTIVVLQLLIYPFLPMTTKTSSMNMKTSLLLFWIGGAMVRAIDPFGKGTIVTAGPGGVTQIKAVQLPTTAGYLNRFVLYAPDRTTVVDSFGDTYEQNINSNHPGNTITTSGLNIAPGGELVFVCLSCNSHLCGAASGTGPFTDFNRIWFTGPGNRNNDGIPHAYVVKESADTYLVGFEDEFGGFDLDYDDSVVRLTLTGGQTLLCDGRPCRKYQHFGYSL